MIDQDRAITGAGIADAGWYAVHTKARHEFLVAQRLAGAGIEVFHPSVAVTRKWKDRNKRIRLPLFPGYLFVLLDQRQASRLAVLKTKGVVRILGGPDGTPEAVPEDQILSIRRIIESGVELDPYPYLREGQRVRITRGPLAGIEGSLVKKTGRSLLVLSIDILMQSASVTIDAADVEGGS